VFEYISACCSAPAQKPRCGMKVASIDPETGRPAKKDKATGLGHFRCSQCRKGCKVKPQAPAKDTQPATTPVVDVKLLAKGVGFSIPEGAVVTSVEVSFASHQS
jgi:hypothetical protein